MRALCFIVWFVLALALLCGAFLPAFGADVVFAWNDPNKPPATRYRISWGTNSRAYVFHSDTAEKTGSATNVALGQRYYVAVQAMDTNGLKSDYSDELSFVLLFPPTTPAPIPLP